QWTQARPSYWEQEKTLKPSFLEAARYRAYASRRIGNVNGFAADMSGCECKRDSAQPEINRHSGDVNRGFALSGSRFAKLRLRPMIEVSRYRAHAPHGLALRE